MFTGIIEELGTVREAEEGKLVIDAKLVRGTNLGDSIAVNGVDLTVGFQDDKVGVTNRGFTGVQTLLWGNDYPHHEGTWPHSQESIAEMFKDVPEDETRQMIGGTAAKVYGF